MRLDTKKILIIFGITILIFLTLFGCTQIQNSPTTEDEQSGEVETVASESGNTQCKHILNNGNPQQKLNFVFISDGFSTEIEFLNRVEQFINLKNSDGKLSFLNFYPFSEFKNFYNIYTFYEPSIHWDCDAQVNMDVYHDLCADRLKVLDKVAEYCDWGLESDYLIILSNKNHRGWADSFGSAELEKVKHLNIPVLAVDSLEDMKKMFLHELLHSLGQLSDEYDDPGKEQYKPIAGIGAKNIDIEGCPKWCSGKMNTSSFAYFIYQEYLMCIDGLDIWDQADDKQFLNCATKTVEPLEMNNCLLGKQITDENIVACFRSTYHSDPDETVFSNCYIEGSRWVCNQGYAQNVDFGINCLSGNGCYWGAGGTNGFRSLSNSYMRDHQSGTVLLGHYNENTVLSNINQIIQERQIRISQLKLSILELSDSSFPTWWIKEVRHDPLQIPFKVTFKTLNQDNQAVIINNNFRNYVTSSSDGIINKNPENGNLELYFTYQLNEKIGQTKINREDFKDITFNIKYNNLEVTETYRFYPYDLTFQQI